MSAGCRRIEQVYQRDRLQLRWGYARSISGVARYFLASPSCSSLYRRSTTSGTRYVYLQPTTATSVGGLALVACNPIAPWERVVDLQFARRPGSRWHLYVEIMANTATSSSQTKAKSDHRTPIKLAAAIQRSSDSTGQRTTTQRWCHPSKDPNSAGRTGEPSTGGTEALSAEELPGFESGTGAVNGVFF